MIDYVFIYALLTATWIYILVVATVYAYVFLMHKLFTNLPTITRSRRQDDD